MQATTFEQIIESLGAGKVVPYLGCGVLKLVGNCPVPSSPEALVAKLVAKSSVPHKLLKNLTGAAQFIENFKHRKTLATGMTEAFRVPVAPSSLHEFLADSMPPLMVHVWYDDAARRAFAGKSDWGCVQGVSQSEHFGEWTRWYDAAGEMSDASTGEAWSTLLYEPIGSVSPATNYLVSDTDYVEFLTEIDIQTPVPEKVKALRRDRNFLFLGCRFNTQLDRILAHQVSKRSSDKHWAVLPETPTRNEKRFMEEHGIERIDIALEEFAAQLMGAAAFG
ncbi:MAG: SIR2 family protein [Fibrobacterota bacterium]